MADFADDDLVDVPETVTETEPVVTEADEADETTIEIDGEEEDAAPASDEESGTQLVRQLRQTAREQARELARLRAQTAPKPPQVIDPGPKPTLESCGWDEDAFEQSLDAWKDKVKAADAAKAAQQSEAEAVASEWGNDLARYQQRKQAVKIPDYQDAEDTVIAVLNPAQQAAIVQVADVPEHVVAALARHPAKLAEIAKIANPFKLAKAIVKLEGSLKVVTNRKAPAPEKVVQGTASPAGRTDKHLERLEAEAERTGDRTKVVAYKRSLKA